MSSFFITTAIDYTNAAPHIGHAYEKVLADVIARHRRLQGDTVYFLTGVDQHGQKVQQAAQKAGIPPQEFADDVTAKFVHLWERLGVSYDDWAATTAVRHKQAVQRILQDLYERGALYKATHQGFYSVRQEQFLTDKERNEEGVFGVEWGEVVFIEEENWYFKLSGYIPWLIEFLQKRTDYVLPAFRQTELINAVAKTTGDLCISRPKSRLSWGIEFPFDPDFVTYVWFDALINYISFPGYQSDDEGLRHRFKAFWPADLHVIGKDILVPAHGVYWPCMLRGMGFSQEQMPTLLVHGWWNRGGAKVSKSVGNVIDPVDLLDRYGVDAVRYYLVRDIATGQDADFSEERLVMLYNTELANGLGNLLNRTVNMSHRYRQGTVQPLPENLSDASKRLLEAARGCVRTYGEAMERYDIQRGINDAIALVSEANGFVEQQAPWKLAKDPSKAALLDEVLTVLVLVTRAASILLMPVIPAASKRIFDQLQMPSDLELATDFRLPQAHQLGEPAPVFPRIEEEKA